MIRIQDYIKCYDDIMDPKVCRKIIKEDKTDFDRATVKGEIVNDYRKCYFKKVEKKFESDIYPGIGKILKLYEKDFKYFMTGLTCEDTGYEHLLYKGSEKGEYKEHIDHFDLHPRVLSCSIILNENYDGGDFSFFEGEHIVPKKTGSAVVFPSNFCFPHAVTPVANGDRHAIITWIH